MKFYLKSLEICFKILKENEVKETKIKGVVSFFNLNFCKDLISFSSIKELTINFYIKLIIF